MKQKCEYVRNKNWMKKSAFLKCTSLNVGGQGEIRDVDGKQISVLHKWVKRKNMGKSVLPNRDARTRLLSFLTNKRASISEHTQGVSVVWLLWSLACLCYFSELLLTFCHLYLYFFEHSIWIIRSLDYR